MALLEFTKFTGAGNDFIVADDRAGKLKGRPALARKLLDRKYGIGADGLILLERSKKAEVRMRIYNPDGSEAEMCGNGIRCLALFAFQKGLLRSGGLIESGAGVHRAVIGAGGVRVGLTKPEGLRTGIRLKTGGEALELSFVNTGVPHAVCEVRDVEKARVEELGRRVRRHAYFAPAGTNVNFVQRSKGASSLAVRTYERGVEAETLACGTGSTASALVCAFLHGLTSPVRVRTRGGEVLKVHFKREKERFFDVCLEGPVRPIFQGRVKG